MKLPKHLQCDIDYLIPHEIIKAYDLARFDLDLLVLGESCQGIWPSMRLQIDGRMVWQGTVENEQQICLSHPLDVSRDYVDLYIQFYGKQDHTGTLVNAAGEILENQCIRIKKLIINDIDLVENGSIYNLGRYHMQLSADKLSYFRAHGYDTEPKPALDMFDNGEFRLRFGIPVTRAIIKIVCPQRTQDRWPDNDLLISIIKKCDSVDKLQRLLERSKK